MIYLSDGNTPLNAAYDDNITQEANSTYQLTFRFPTNNILWQRLREETFLTADDLHGEQDFVIFEVEKHHGYIQVYANQVMTLLNNYVIGPLALDRVSGSTALSQFAGSITRENPFSFFSDIDDRHTFNTDSINAMAALTKDKHSILGQWGGDLVRHGYQVRLLKNGGSENESLFMYQKNLSNYKQKTSTKSLKTRITFKKTIKGSSENNDERKIAVVVDSPLINKYSQIYEDVVEVNDQDVKDEASLREYGKQYFRTCLCDLMEDNIEIDVVGQSDVPVQIFDVVCVYHETFDLDVRKKITKYNYSPMAKKLKSIGFGQFQSGLASAIGNAVSDAVKNETQHLDGIFEEKLAKEIQNADLAFDRKKEELTNQFTDEVNAIKAKAEENKQALSDEINRRFHDFSPAGFEEAKAKAEEALRKAGAIPELQDRFESLDREQNSQGTQLYQMSNEFQRVKETAQLYERILGNTQNGISDNISRMVMTNQVFQTEVGKYSTQGGPNLLRNSRADDGLKYWNGAPNEFHFREHEFYMNGQKRMFLLDSGALVYSQRFIFKRNTDYILNLIAFDANTERVRITLRKRKKDSSNPDYDEVQTIFNKTGTPAFSSERAVKRSFKFNTGDFDNGYLVFQYFGNPTGWSGMFMTELDFYEGSNDRKWQPAPEDSVEPIEAVKTKVTQLAGSWAVQNLTNAGSIASQINTNANNILIEASKIRLKGRTLADEITAIDGYFKRLFVGEGNFATLNTDVLRSNSIAGDKLAVDQALIDKLVASDVFTNTLSAKNAFINRLRSTIVSATLLEGYKGKIGGFQIGTHEKDPNSYWFTGLNQFQVGMGSGNGKWGQTALWVNWGNNWNSPGDTAWYVKNNGEMYCYNQAHFWNTPIIHGNLKVSGNIYYITDDNTKQGGYWIHSPSFKRIQENAGYIYLYHFDDSYVWIPINKEVSDRRFKTNIKDSQVSGLDVIESLKTYSYRKEYDEKIEDISCGIMAQDVQKYAPEAFFENPDGAYSYNTFVLVPYLIKAIQELNQKVERLETTT
ncbi:phage tail spike protein [uncultured Streptococcus sp.]|uniref:phage tail spike protein n=1 Tax=uncultured Streptococcus sp. TaxID=83427 RepID=UPI003211CA5C